MSTATISETVKSLDGTAAVGTVVLALAPAQAGYAASTLNTLYPPITLTLDAGGAWSQALERTDTMLPSGMMYSRTLVPRNGAILVSYFVVPGAGPYTFETVVQPAPVQGGAASAITTLVAGSGITIANPSGPIATVSRTRYSWLTLPDNWDANWTAAKAGSGSAPATIGLYGDSIGQGSVVTDWKTQSFFELLRANLISRYSLSGDFYPPVYNTAFQPSVGSMPFSIAGGAGAFGSWGFLQTYLWTAAAFTNPALTFDSSNTPTPAFSDADVHSLNFAAGTFTYQVDALTGVVVTNFTDASITKTPIASIVSGAHTIKLTAESADYAGAIAGISTFQSRASGLFFARFAAAGFRASDWGLTVGTQPADRIKLQQGTTHAGAATGYGPPTQPDLAIIELGVNDCQFPISLDRFEGSLRRFCQAFRRGKSNASILFIIPSMPDGTSGEVTSGNFSNPENWPLYIDRIYAVAAAFGAAVLNIHAAWASQGVALGYQAANQPHPGITGHAWIATQLEAIL